MADAFHVYAGSVVVTVPDGETVTGAAGGGGTEVEFTVIDFAALQALVPALLEAFTNQLYEAPFASAALGVKEHVLVHPAAAGVTLWLTATPDVFCTRR